MHRHITRSSTRWPTYAGGTPLVAVVVVVVVVVDMCCCCRCYYVVVDDVDGGVLGRQVRLSRREADVACKNR